MKTMRDNITLLLADDEENFLYGFRVSLELAGFKNIHQAVNISEIFSVLESHSVDIVFLDLNMPGAQGLEHMKRIRQEFPDIEVVILTAVDSTETAVLCMQEGAYDYIVKPVNRSRLLLTLEKLMNHLQIKRDMSNLQKAYFSQHLQREECFEDILTRSNTMNSIFSYIEAISQSSQPVLVSGETGVGKELIARSIYCCSNLKGPYLTINIAGLDDTTFNDSLFGHKKGAFTGADSDREGLLKNAEGGALLLDEIGELNESSQVKLLRLLNDGSYYPLGSDKPKTAHLRFILATNKDLDEQVKKGRFRKDLYYRLITHHIIIPPLRERREDISYILRSFLTQANTMMKKKVFLSGPAISMFSDYSYPGNVRELKSIVFDCVANTQDGENIDIPYLEKRLSGSQVKGGEEESGDYRPLTMMTLADAETELIRIALKRHEGNQSKASEDLGISRQALNKKIKRNPDLVEDL